MVDLSPVTVAGSFRPLLIGSWENMKKGSDEEDEYAVLFVSNRQTDVTQRKACN